MSKEVRKSQNEVRNELGRNWAEDRKYIVQAVLSDQSFMD